MAFEIMKEELRVKRRINSEGGQIKVENDFVVPEKRADIYKVLNVSARADIKSIEIQRDKVYVTGELFVNTLFLTDDQVSISGMDDKLVFSGQFDVSGVDQEAIVKAKCEVAKVTGVVLNVRKFAIRAFVDVTLSIEQDETAQYTSGFSDREGIFIQEGEGEVESFCGLGEKLLNIEDRIDLPKGKPEMMSLIRSDVKLLNKRITFDSGCFKVEGEVGIRTLYLGTGEELEVVDHSFPFSKEIDISEATDEEEPDVEMKIGNFSMGIDEDDDGERRILVRSAEIKVEYALYRRVSINRILDVYSQHDEIGIQKQNLVYNGFPSIFESPINLKEVVRIEGTDVLLDKLLNLECKPYVTGHYLEEGQLIVDGYFKCSLLYATGRSEQSFEFLEKDVPYRSSIDVFDAKPENIFEILVSEQFCHYTLISQREVEISITASVQAKEYKQNSIELLSSVTNLGTRQEKFNSVSEIILYFVQEGDDLWSIAKRYLSSIEDIKENNSEINSNSDLIVGRQILILKKRS